MDSKSSNNDKIETQIITDLVDLTVSPVSNDKNAFGSVGAHFLAREKQVDEFIRISVENHRERWTIKRKYQVAITRLLLSIVALFSLLLILSILLVMFGVVTDVSSIISILSSAGAAFIASVFSLLTIIVKYIFPPKEEENSMNVLKTAVNIDYKYYIAKNGLSEGKSE